MAKTHEDFENANKWQKLNDNKKDNYSNKKDYDAEYLNNKKADSVLRAERMTDKELLDAYEKNEKDYVASKEKPPVVDQKKPSLPMEAFKKLINWVIVKLNELCEIAKATLLRVAIGKDGVSKVIDNTRKDEEKAERQQKLEREISELDKNAIREELKRRGLGKDSPENVNNGKGQEPSKQESPNQEPPKQEKEAEDALGKSDKTRLDRLYLGSMSWSDEKSKEDFAKFKAEYEAYIKDYTGLTVNISGRQANQELAPTKQGALCIKIIDEKLGDCSFEYRGDGNIEHISNEKTEKLVNELEKLTSHYINDYDKDSQKSRTASGIYPGKNSIRDLVGDIKFLLSKENPSKTTIFYGSTINGCLKDGHITFTVNGKDIKEFAGKEGILSEAEPIYKAIKAEIDKDINKYHDKGSEKEEDSKTFKDLVTNTVKELEAEKSRSALDPTKTDEPVKTNPDVSTGKDDKEKTDVEPDISPETPNDDSIGKQDPDVGDSVTPEPIDNTPDNTHEAGNESSNFSVIANFGGEDISAFTPLEDCGEQVFGDDDLEQMFNFENELDEKTKTIPDGKDDIEEEDVEIGA
ncbi:hypothetical protein SAMN05216349_14210 [Oribacterium sp. KHPX15]|uniref:hypothetical protein n=1 Tax=Oribacterium sp. KHPX15 TaxID=1855342 RepID=UPI000897C77D|nr:hypothetical protein [Oribacterium sp. KHPX15]SEA87663.1 hypothetical protein SAMN05216349_14210 [Oribacterium sp. KHPX15]